MIPTGNGLRDAALSYAARGWKVFPLHTPFPAVKADRCSCGKLPCSHPGKHPRTKNGFKDATLGTSQIIAWWKRWPGANVGIATGGSGPVVLDVDPHNGGSRNALPPGLPDTVEVVTGSGGCHIYFAGDIKSASIPGFDLKGEGGYVVAPPSLHSSGKRYEWEISSQPDDVPLAPIPDEVIRMFEGDHLRDHRTDQKRTMPKIGEVIPPGQRNAVLTSLAGSMRRRGMSEAGMIAALKIENDSRCQPPLTDEEVQAIACSVGRYEPSDGNVISLKSALLPSADGAHLHTPPDIARDQDILARFVRDLRVCGVVGEQRNAKLVYLALTSRILPEPVSLAIKGISSSGKSHIVETVVKFFPTDAFIAMTAMSERALIYMQEDFSHRTLVLFEAVALREQREKSESNMTAYFVRSLLSEGRISYPVTQRDKSGNFVTKTIVKSGPTNLILTTTAISLHGENETRMFSLPTDDSQEQTRAILRQLARGGSGTVGFSEWHRFQEWIQNGAERRVLVPFALALAELIPTVAVRLRRDFRSILRLIETHAILHQLSREKDAEGRIVAVEEDYQAVRELVADLVADGVGATVGPTVRETVEAVSALGTDDGATVAQVAAELKLDRSAAQRRLQAARSKGFIVNEEERRGRPARYKLGDPLPDEQELLPHTLTPPHGVVCAECAGQQGVCICA